MKRRNFLTASLASGLALAAAPALALPEPLVLTRWVDELGKLHIEGEEISSDADRLHLEPGAIYRRCRIFAKQVFLHNNSVRSCVFHMAGDRPLPYYNTSRSKRYIVGNAGDEVSWCCFTPVLETARSLDFPEDWTGREEELLRVITQKSNEEWSRNQGRLKQ